MSVGRQVFSMPKIPKRPTISVADRKCGHPDGELPFFHSNGVVIEDCWGNDLWPLQWEGHDLAGRGVNPGFTLTPTGNKRHLEFLRKGRGSVANHLAMLKLYKSRKQPVGA